MATNAAGKVLTATTTKSRAVQWGAAGWTFFVVENAVLSENRTYLIKLLGQSEDNYRMLYGTISTLATASIGYTYYRIANCTSSMTMTMPSLFPGAAVVPVPHRVAAWVLLSTGLGLASQTLPKMQIPVTLHGDTSSLTVRCPFDFKHGPQHLSSDDDHDDGIVVHGVERVTRHAGLWSLGLAAAGNALLQSQVALRAWWLGPALVAWLGGWHQDSRYRRGLGGTLDPVLDSQTSHVPFAALASGKQGDPAHALSQLAAETKPLNVVLAVGVATAWVLTRGRIMP